VAALLLALLCCAPPPPGENVVRLRWLRGYPEESWEVARDGTWWALSDLGAVPTASAMVTHQAEDDRVTFDVDVSLLSLGDAALAALQPARAELMGSEEMATHGAVDLGRFLLRTLYEPWRYYGITGACLSPPTLAAPELYAVTTSTLVSGHRLVSYTVDPRSVGEILYVASEGTGSLEDGSFVPGESETVTVMPNGQFRYAVYDGAGDLVPAASESPAGQPGKCRWCHEYQVQRGTSENASAEGFVDYARFVEQVEVATARIEEARAEVPIVSWPGAVAHERAERLVDAFSWPSVERIELEYGAMDVAGLEVTDLPEHGWTSRYRRQDIDARAPFAVIPVVTDTREASGEYADAELEGCEGN
jgi:hypothetical protein